MRREKKWLGKERKERKDLTETKIERTRTRVKIMLSAFPSSVFHTKFTISDLKSKYIFYSN